MRYITLFLGIILGCQPALGTSIYVYIDASGSYRYADQPIEAPHQYKLIKTYEADNYFGTGNRPLDVIGLAAVPGQTESANQNRILPKPSAFDAIIVRYAEKYDLEPALLKAIVHVESGFNPDAVSSKGAVGLMQLMPETARHYGVNKRTDPQESLSGGCRYMTDLLQRFDSNLDMALAAYNAGESAVARYSGIPPYPETTQYIHKVKGLLAQYRQNLDGA